MKSWLRQARDFFRRRGSAEASDGYAIVSADVARNIQPDAPDTGGWHHTAVAWRQDAAYRELLTEMRQGRPRKDLVTAAEAIRQTHVAAASVLEVGCGSGYYADVIAYLTRRQLRYVGIDSSRPMIQLARDASSTHDFVIADAIALPFKASTFDIVFNGVSLMHIMRYEAAIAESRRVSRRWCIFHTVPLVRRRPTTFLRKLAYGHPVLEVIFNDEEFRSLLVREGFVVRSILESIPYDLQTVLGEPSWTSTFVCEASNR